MLFLYLPQAFFASRPVLLAPQRPWMFKGSFSLSLGLGLPSSQTFEMRTSVKLIHPFVPGVRQRVLYLSALSSAEDALTALIGRGAVFVMNAHSLVDEGVHRALLLGAGPREFPFASAGHSRGCFAVAVDGFVWEDGMSVLLDGVLRDGFALPWRRQVCPWVFKNVFDVRGTVIVLLPSCVGFINCLLGPFFVGQSSCIGFIDRS